MASGTWKVCWCWPGCFNTVLQLPPLSYQAPQKSISKVTAVWEKLSRATAAFSYYVRVTCGCYSWLGKTSQGPVSVAVAEVGNGLGFGVSRRACPCNGCSQTPQCLPSWQCGLGSALAWLRDPNETTLPVRGFACSLAGCKQDLVVSLVQAQ